MYEDCLDIALYGVFSRDFNVCDLDEARQMCKGGKISESQLLDIIQRAVINQARKDYDFTWDKRHGKDMGVFHQVLPLYNKTMAYAIKKSVFSDEELAKLRFFHAENFSNFCKEYYNENLLNEIQEKFLNPVELPPMYNEGDIWHPVCDCY